MTPSPTANRLQEKANSENPTFQTNDQPTGVQWLSSVERMATRRLRRSAAKALLGFMDHFMGGHSMPH